MKRAISLVLVVALSGGCATVPALAPTVAINVEKRVESRPLPPDPSTEALPPGTPADDWVLPLEAGSCLDKAGKAVSGAVGPCPSLSGISLSESRAARAKLFQIRYPELRRLYEADRMVWSAHRELYEERLQQADQKIRDMQPNWFERHAVQLGVVGGFVLGAALTVSLTYAIHQTTKP